MANFIPVEPEKWAEMVKALAEVERLKMEESKLLTLCETYEAEVERLRKAGDAMDDCIDCGCESCSDARDAWNAAKEGKDL